MTLDDSARDPDHLQFPDYAFTNHRVDAGGTRDVHYLKSANMSYRMSAVRGSAVRFDTRLRGMGVQLNHDMAFGLAVRRAGWRLAYDPAVEVDGYPLRPCIEDVRILRAQANHPADLVARHFAGVDAAEAVAPRVQLDEGLTRTIEYFRKKLAD